MCLIALVLSDAKRPEKPQPCGDEYDECPPGYICEYDVCVKIVPPTTTTTKKPTPPKPSKDNILNLKQFSFFSAQCCWRGNRFRNCFWCIYPSSCYAGKYCYTLPTRPPTTTPKPKSCNNDYDCPSGYKCDYKICVAIPTTTTKKPTPPKPKQCCWWGNRFRNCYSCFTKSVCIQGQYCKYVTPPTFPPRPTTPPTTTTQPPSTPQPCGEKGKCYPED
uniref:Uncharacterized protein n=1 Tax=Meloidogyne enterolobii TaxID=390850 RepID=A0A6V7UMU2_MELEN|nr:unnamed protein product [Meloidogyne enterolobii]